MSFFTILPCHIGMGGSFQFLRKRLMNVHFGSFVAWDIMDTIVMIIDKGQELLEFGQGCTS